MRENENMGCQNRLLLSSALRSKGCVKRNLGSESADHSMSRLGAWSPFSHDPAQDTAGEKMMDTTLLIWSHRPFQTVWPFDIQFLHLLVG